MHGMTRQPTSIRTCLYPYRKGGLRRHPNRKQRRRLGLSVWYPEPEHAAPTSLSRAKWLPRATKPECSSVSTLIRALSASAASDSITAIPEGARRIARVAFHVAQNAAAGESKLTFDESVISNVTADPNGLLLTASYDQTGRITIPAAAGITISGRVTTPEDAALRNATVTIVYRSGFARTVTTSAFGYYIFTDIAVGETYTIGVTSRAYRFASRTSRPPTTARTSTLSGGINLCFCHITSFRRSVCMSIRNDLRPSFYAAISV